MDWECSFVEGGSVDCFVKGAVQMNFADCFVEGEYISYWRSTYLDFIVMDLASMLILSSCMIKIFIILIIMRLSFKK